jgi:hypothetical protein
MGHAAPSGKITLSKPKLGSGSQPKGINTGCTKKEEIAYDLRIQVGKLGFRLGVQGPLGKIV